MTINGYDVHERLSTYTVTEEVTYRKVVTALDDTEYPYPAKKRPIITFSLWPMTEAESSKLYDALNDSSISVTFTNQHKNQEETRRFRVVSDLESAFALLSVDGLRRYKGGEIQLRGA